jgi:hypothetical protein
LKKKGKLHILYRQKHYANFVRRFVIMQFFSFFIISPCVCSSAASLAAAKRRGSFFAFTPFDLLEFMQLFRSFLPVLPLLGGSTAFAGKSVLRQRTSALQP